MGTLRSYVHVFDDAGQAHVFGPGDDVPDWAAERITNPRAWETPPEGRSVETVAVNLGGAPPRSGAGSNRDAWLKHAVAIGVLAADSTASRDDIIAAVDAADSSTTGAGSDSDEEE
jgi:hypothetical protein